MSESDVDKFLADTHTEGTSKLAPWESQIFELLGKNASYEKIRRFLESQNVKAVRSQIIYFVKAKKRAALYAEAMSQRTRQPTPAKTGKPDPTQPQPQPQQQTKTKTEEKSEANPKTPDKPEWEGLPPKFVYNLDDPKPEW